MKDPFVSRVGGVLSADIAVPEHDREMRFYARVLTTGEEPLWREDLMNSRGMPVIGLGARRPEHADLPLQWTPHIQVADVAASVDRALDSGGRELMHGKDEEGRSQWAVLLDPNGAAFGLIPVEPAGSIAPDEGEASGGTEARVGCIRGLELNVADAASTRDFYRQVVGWSVQDLEMAAEGERYSDHTMGGDDGRRAAVIRQARGVNQGLSPIWMIQLPVGDLAESLRRVREGGGKVIEEARGTQGEPAYGAIQDPIGACLALVQG